MQPPCVFQYWGDLLVNKGETGICRFSIKNNAFVNVSNPVNKYLDIMSFPQRKKKFDIMTLFPWAYSEAPPSDMDRKMEEIINPGYLDFEGMEASRALGWEGPIWKCEYILMA